MKTKTLGLSLVAVALFSVAVFAVSAQKSPALCRGSWTRCNLAFSDDTSRAVGTGNVATGTWQNYGFSIPDGNTIDSVVVRADFFASRANGYMAVRVSGNGGFSWGPYHVVGGNLAEQTFNIPVTTDVSWTPAKLGNVYLRVQARCIKINGTAPVACNLDWIPVNVAYHASANETNSTCVRANPTLSISPALQSGAPGTTLAYTTTVRNNDNSLCSPSTFRMYSEIPSGWAGVFSRSSLLLAPGASDTTLFNLTSSTNSTPGNYTFTNIALNSVLPSFSGTGSAIYRVA